MTRQLIDRATQKISAEKFPHCKKVSAPVCFVANLRQWPHPGPRDFPPLTLSGPVRIKSKSVLRNRPGYDVIPACRADFLRAPS
jgi:hypothetical protein